MPGQAGSSSIDAPALPGWADVWRAGPPGLGSGWVLFCRSLTQELIKLWHCQQPVRQSWKELIWTSLAQLSPGREFAFVTGSAGGRRSAQPLGTVRCAVIDLRRLILLKLSRHPGGRSLL